MAMENWVGAQLMLIFVATLTVCLGLIHTGRRQGRGRRLLHLTTTLSKDPRSTILVRIPFLTQQYILTADPENVQHILKTNFQNYPKGAAFRSTLEEVFGECIVNADGQEWHTQRAFLAREFSVSFLHFYGDTILDSEIQERLLPLLTNIATIGVVIDLQDVLLRFALDNICRATFTYDPKCLEYASGALPRSEFSEAFDNASFLMGNRIKSMLPPKLLSIKKALKIGSENELIKSAEAVKRIIIGTVLVNNNDGDFLSRLRQRDDDEPELMANMVAGVILAGRDTTSAVLTWFFWLVSTTPRVEAIILEEIASLTLNKGAYEGVREMPYTHAALCETMRLYPPIPLVVKEAQNDDVLPAGGMRVRGGDRVVVVSYAVGRLERVWGPDWREFRPERWLVKIDNSSSVPGWRFVGTDPYRFPAFNAGPRICLGKEMAFLQMKRVVAAVLGRFRIVPSHHSEPEFVFDITAKMKGGFPVRVEARQIIQP